MITFIVELGTPNKNGLCKIYILPYLNKGLTKGEKLKRIPIEHKILKPDFNPSAKYGKWVRSTNINYAKINQDIETTIQKYKENGETLYITIETAFKLWRKGYNEVTSAAHIQAVDFAIKSFVKVMGDMRVLEITPLTIKEYLANVPISTNTKINYLSRIRNVIEVIEPKTTIFSNIKIKRTPTNRTYLTPEEVETIKQAPKTPIEQMAFDIWYFSYKNRGIRGRDCLLLTGNELITSKNKKKIVLKFDHEIEELLKKYAGGKYLFPYMEGKDTSVHNTTKVLSNIYKSLTSLAKKNKINKKVGMHTARHSYAWLLIINKIDIYTASNLFTHNNPGTTATYLKDFSDEYLQDVNEGLFKNGAGAK